MTRKRLGVFVALLAMVAALMEGPAAAQEVNDEDPDVPAVTPEAPEVVNPEAPGVTDGENPEGAVATLRAETTGARATVYDSGKIEICDTAGDAHSVGVEFYMNGDTTSRIVIRLYAGEGKCTARVFGGSSVQFRAVVFEGDARVPGRQSAYKFTSLPNNPGATRLYNSTDYPASNDCSSTSGARACFHLTARRQLMSVCDTAGDGHHARTQAYIDFSTGRQTLARTEIQEFGGTGRCTGLFLQGEGLWDRATYRAAVYEGDGMKRAAPYERNADD